MVDVPHLLLGHLVAYQLHGRLVCLRIRFIYAAPEALVEHMFCLLPSSLCGMEEHRVILQTGGEFQDPTRGTHPGRAPNPLISLTPEQRSPPPQPSLKPPTFSEHSFHIVVPKGRVTSETTIIRIHPTTAMESLQSYFMSTP